MARTARRPALVLICIAALAGCSSGGYGKQNQLLAQPILELDTINVVGEPTDQSYCSQDSCWLGDDATTTTYELTYDAGVDGRVEDISDALTGALPGWGVIVVDDCDDPEADCGADNLIYAVRGGQLMSLLINNDGSGELTVDARSTAVETYN